MKYIPTCIIHCFLFLPRSDPVPVVSSVKTPTVTGKANPTKWIDLGEEKKSGLSKYESYCLQMHLQLPQVQHTYSRIIKYISIV